LGKEATCDWINFCREVILDHVESHTEKQEWERLWRSIKADLGNEGITKVTM
jgi:hypothetical protein